MNNQINISPSILSADFSTLGDQIQKLEQGGADWIHIDVMDGHFVPNLSFGPFILNVVRRFTKLPMDVHLMVSNPEILIPAFLKAGADWITVHVESCQNKKSVLTMIKSGGCKAGLALKPGTPVESIVDVIPLLDMVLILGNNPGFSGQGWIPESEEKIGKLKQLLEESGSSAIIEVDGGINQQTLPKAFQAGAKAFVSGSAIFGFQDGIAAGISSLRKTVAELEN